MEDDDFPFISVFLWVLERTREEGIHQVILHPDILGSSDVPSIILIWEATVDECVTGYHTLKLPFKKLRDLTT